MSAMRFGVCFAAVLLLLGCAPQAAPPVPVPAVSTNEVSPPPAVPTEPFELNGIRFTQVPSGDSLGCKEPLRPASPAERAASPLAFTATYLPPGFTLNGSMADSCDGRVASLGSMYGGTQGSINIARWTMRVFRMPDVAPQAVQVAGKPGVRLGAGLLLVEPWGITSIEVTGLSYEETLKIAEGLRPTAP